MHASLLSRAIYLVGGRLRSTRRGGHDVQGHRPMAHPTQHRQAQPGRPPPGAGHVRRRRHAHLPRRQLVVAPCSASPSRAASPASPTGARAEIEAFLVRYVEHGLQMEVEDVLVNGPPWNARAAAIVHDWIPALTATTSTATARSSSCGRAGGRSSTRRTSRTPSASAAYDRHLAETRRPEPGQSSGTRTARQRRTMVGLSSGGPVRPKTPAGRSAEPRRSGQSVMVDRRPRATSSATSQGQVSRSVGQRTCGSRPRRGTGGRRPAR